MVCRGLGRDTLRLDLGFWTVEYYWNLWKFVFLLVLFIFLDDGFKAFKLPFLEPGVNIRVTRVEIG